MWWCWQCCGTITNPKLLFVDEPTSGLDSAAALVVMRLLHMYCKKGMMIICTIHQPRPAIWSLFEKVIERPTPCCYPTRPPCLPHPLSRPP